MTSYNVDSFNSMHRDAMKRIKELHQRALPNEEVKEIETAQISEEPIEIADIPEGTSAQENTNENNQKSNSIFQNNPLSQMLGNFSNPLKGGSLLGNLSNPLKNGPLKDGASMLSGILNGKSNPDKDSSGDFLSGILGKTGSIGDLLKKLNIDEEKLLILFLIYILYKNGSDYKLLLALGYLIV